MKHSRRHGLDPSLAVLSLSRDGAEWLEGADTAAALYGRHKVSGLDPEDLARAALSAREAAGGKASRLLLALGSGLVRTRLVPLPPIERRDLRGVLLRKAAQLVDASPEETLFAATQMQLPSESPEAAKGGESAIKKEDRWLVAALERHAVQKLMLALRRAQLEVERTVCARLARLSVAQLAEGPHSSAVVIDIEPACITVSLLNHGSLLQQTELDGDLDATPTLALSVIQEAKGFESFWRRTSRGERLGKVCVVGLDSKRGELLSHALTTALPETQVELFPRESQSPTAGRIASLAACRGRGTCELDLTLSLPMPKSRRIAIATGLAATLGLIGGFVYSQVAGRVERLARETDQLLAQSRDLDAVEAETQLVASARASLDLERDRMAALRREGVSLERTLSDVQRAFAGRAELRALRIQDPGGGLHLMLDGSTTSEPMRAAALLDELRAELEASPVFDEVEIELPSQLSGDHGGGSSFEFVVQARIQAAEVNG